MRRLATAVFARLGFAWARDRLADETRRELDAHRDLLVDRYRRAGMSDGEARVAAARQMGNATLVTEEIYRMNGIALLDGLRDDLRYALRQVRRNPGFSAVVIATLALGIGGTTAVFSAVQAVLVAPLPYDQPGQLVRFYQQEPDKPDTRHVIAATHFTFLRDHAAAFEDVAAMAMYSETGADLVRDGRGHRLRVLAVTSGYFGTLRSGLAYGSGFDRADDSGTRRIVLSDTVWRTHFGGDPAVIGHTIHLSAEPFEVVGIAPRTFKDPIAGDVDVWTPYDLVGDRFEENYSLTAIGRLRDGVSLEQGRAGLVPLRGPMKDRWPAARRSEIVAVPLQEDLVAPSRGPLHLLLIAVALVLLVASVNVANLVLVRATGRTHEFAIRSALGSGRGRLARQTLVESLLLAGFGGALGLVFARNGALVLQRLGHEALPRLAEIGFDPVVLGFALLTTVATAVACGVVPAVRLARTPPIEVLRQQSRSATGSRGQARLRGGLAIAQLALALTLLVGAGVLLATLHRLQRVDLGFRVDRLLTFEVNLPTARYGVTRRIVFHEELARAIRAIPGVTAVGSISRLPATGSYHPWGTRIVTGPSAGTMISSSRGFAIQQRTISGELFAALGIPVLAGRSFDGRDHAGVPSHAVVSASFARAAFPGLPLDAALGQRIAPLGRAMEIVGVAGDVALDVYGKKALTVYRPHSQFAGNRNWALTQVVAADLPPEQLLEPVRAAVARIDPELTVHRPAALEQVVGRGHSRQRFALVLMGAFAAVGLILAALGLYGVLDYGVRQRAREIGIRVALGATGAEIRTLVLKQAAVILGAGLAAGAVGALLLGRWLSSLLFEVSASDPRIFAATALVLAITGVVAAWLPARRASRVPPTVALQE